MNIPKSDIELADRLNQTFNIFQKTGKNTSWNIIEKGITLIEAMSKVKEANTLETGVFTQSGKIYWTSKLPELFNSDVIKYGQSEFVKTDYFRLTWDAYFNVKTPEKVEKILKKITKELELDIETEQIKNHSSNESMIWVMFSCKLHLKDIEQAIFETLYINGFLAEQWNIVSPYQEDEERWSFSGLAKHIKIQGINSISFLLQNFSEKI